MATNFGTSYFRIVIITVSAAATNVFHAAIDTAERFGRYVRELFVDDPPLLPRFDASCPPVIVDERALARSAAPVARFEPAFVGGGLAFRRWR